MYKKLFILLLSILFLFNTTACSSKDDVAESDTLSSKSSYLPSAEVSSKPTEVSSTPTVISSTQAEVSSTPLTSSSNSTSSSPSEVEIAKPVESNTESQVLKMYDDILKINNEVCGRLIIPHTNIDYFIPQGKDNNYYLFDGNKLDGTKDAFGTPFMLSNSTSSSGIMERHTFFFGLADFKNETRLFALRKYKDVSFYKEAPVIEYSTLYETYKWKILCFSLVDTSKDATFKYGSYLSISSDEQAEEYVAGMKATSYFSTSVDFLPSDKLISIQTNGSNDGKETIVLVARMIRNGESEAVDTSGATQLK